MFDRIFIRTFIDALRHLKPSTHQIGLGNDRATTRIYASYILRMELLCQHNFYHQLRIKFELNKAK